MPIVSLPLTIDQHEQVKLILNQQPSHTAKQQLRNILSEIAASQQFTISSPDPFSFFLARIGCCPVNSIPVSLQPLVASFKQFSKNSKAISELKHHSAQRLQLRAPLPALTCADDPVPGLPANIPRIFVKRLRQPYPPLGHYIHERPDLPLPTIPPVKDTSCSSCQKYHVLDTSNLQYTLNEFESAVFIDPDEKDDSKKVVGIVLREFAPGQVTGILEKGEQLVRLSLTQKLFCLRNCPGKIAHAGYTSGARNLRVVGWAHNIVHEFTNQAEHDEQIASLFGLFYALIRSRVPWLAQQFEHALRYSNIPRMDRTGQSTFRIPVTEGTGVGEYLEYIGYDLAPPEGYMAEDFEKWIHIDSCWKWLVRELQNQKVFETMPWGCYWNLCRYNKENITGVEAGASFFLSAYGIRIINSKNGFCAWDITKPHGTGSYYHGLTQVGLSLLLGRSLATTWQKYIEALKAHEISENELLWGYGDESDTEER